MYCGGWKLQGLYLSPQLQRCFGSHPEERPRGAGQELPVSWNAVRYTKFCDFRTGLWGDGNAHRGKRVNDRFNPWWADRSGTKWRSRQNGMKMLLSCQEPCETEMCYFIETFNSLFLASSRNPSMWDWSNSYLRERKFCDRLFHPPATSMLDPYQRSDRRCASENSSHPLNNVNTR